MPPCSVPLREHTELSRNAKISDRVQDLTTEDSSDVCDGPDIRIEEFRCGFPKPLPKNPRIVEFDLDRHNQIWRRCIHKAAAVCDELGLHWREINVYMLLRGPKDARRTPTLHISVEDKSVQPSWKPTLIRIYHMLRAEGALFLHVLIRCNRTPDNYIFPIEFDNQLVTLWPEKLLGPVISIIESHQLNFRAIEVFRFGIQFEDASPTILITIKDEDEDDQEKESTWEKARSDIMGHCQSEGVALPVVLRGSLAARTWSNYDAAATIVGRSNRSYHQLVPMGHSIGVEPKGTGTLGGYLQLKDRHTGAVKLVGLTAYQTVRGSDKNLPADLDKNSTTWPQREGHVCVQSPSEEDHCNEIHELKNYLSDQKKWLGVPSHEKVNELHKSTLKNERLINSITQMEERLKVSQNLNKNDLHVGKVLASSGFRISKKGNHCLDWALIEIDNERIGENQLPDAQNNPELKHLLYWLWESHVHRTLKWPFARGQTFFKTGRTSGTTFGEFSHIKSYVRTEMPANSQDESPPPRNTLEHVFVCSHRPEHRRTTKYFSEEGDAGAWLVDFDEALVGLIWGVSGAGACYVTPIRELMTDIGKHMSGVQVLLPNWEPLQACSLSTDLVPWFVDEPYTLPCWVSPVVLEQERREREREREEIPIPA